MPKASLFHEQLAANMQSNSAKKKKKRRLEAEYVADG